MNDANNTTSDDIQADEEILTYTVSDEALEAAAGMEEEAGGARWTLQYTSEMSGAGCC
jgi:hypothetical protein